MSCDGHKKALLRDTDGTYLGEPGFIVPYAQYAWQGDDTYNIRHGINDARIPKVMQTYIDGTRMDISEVYQERGTPVRTHVTARKFLEIVYYARACNQLTTFVMLPKPHSSVTARITHICVTQI